MTRLRTLSIFAILALLAASTLSAWAVETSGNILGTVRDVTGASVPNAKVTVTNEATGMTRSVSTDGLGEYNLKLLPVGSYTVRIEATGFSTYVQRGITVDVNENARIDAQLRPGAVSQEVEVQADASQVESTVATLGKVVDERKVVGLPLNGRNFLQLGSLQPGVNPISPNLSKSGSGAAADQGFNVNGLRTQANIFMVDGGLDTDLFFTSSVLKPPPDAIQEFRILTNSYSAEYWGGGSVVNLVTKSGTNRFHGALWEFLRNDAFDARNFFAVTTPALKQNQFGFSVGGPVIIPHIYNGKNKTFFYTYYEGFRNRQGITSTAGVPTDLERTGDFSQSATKPINPATGARFPNDKVPINPIAQKLLTLYPGANASANLFTSSPALADDRNGWGVRIDHQFNNSDSMWARYLQNTLDQKQPFVPFGATIPGFPGLAKQLPRTLSAAETHILTPHLLNELRLSYVRINFGSPLFTRRDKLSDFGFQYPTQGPDFETIPVIQITGLSTLGNPQGPALRITNTYEIRDAVSYSRGRHDLKIGADLRRTQYGVVFGSNINGQFTFNGTLSKNALADFYLGLPASFAQGTIAQFDLNGNTYEGYVQDNFRLLPNFTLNLGVRYTYAGAFPTPSNQLFAAYRAGLKSTIRSDAPVGLVYQGDPGVPSGTYNADRNNVAPRIGFAWDPTGAGKWSIRSGFGIFYEYIPGIAAFNAANSSPPGFPSFASSAPPTNFANPLTGFANPFASKNIVLPVGLTSFAKNMVMPIDEQWNLSVQRQMPFDVLLEAAYIGTHGVKLIRFNQANPAVFKAGATLANTQSRRIDPNFRGVTQIENTATSHYNGLQLSANKRFVHGLTFLASYTWSKTIDDGSYFNISQNTNPGNVNFPMIPSNLQPERGLSLYDIRQRFVLSGAYDLPFARNMTGVAGSLLGGWQINWIYAMQSGQPFTVFEPLDISLTAVGADRPNVIGDPNVAPRTVAQWFNTAAFQRLNSVTQAGQFGNEGRDTIFAPPFRNLDFSVAKNFRINEAARVQFRSEFFNILNHPNFNIPDGNIGSATFGRILDARDPRILQFALKLIY